MGSGRVRRSVLAPILGLLGTILIWQAAPVLAADTAPGRPTTVHLSNPAPTGADISYPGCGSPLPPGQAFAVVGVNGGRANTRNPCLERELAWAEELTTGSSSQPNLSLYLNTGDPGSYYLGQPVPDWPLWGSTPLGGCLPRVESGHPVGPGQDSVACAWEYGYQKAVQDLDWLAEATAPLGLPTAPGAYSFWLDVELSNSWSSSTQMNSADLEGMVYGLSQAGVVELGVYALPVQWQVITGGTPGPGSGSLYGLAGWLPGAGSLTQAATNCSKPAFTGGPVELTQFPGPGFDADYAC